MLCLNAETTNWVKEVKSGLERVTGLVQRHECADCTHSESCRLKAVRMEDSSTCLRRAAKKMSFQR